MIAQWKDDVPSGVGFLKDGTPVVVSRGRRQIVRVTPEGGLVPLVDVNHLPGTSLNDMVVDDRERMYVDNALPRSRPANSLIPETYAPEEGLLLIDRDRTARIAATGLQAPNGLAITANRRELIVAETWIGRLTSFTIEDDGSLTNRSLFAHVPGSTLDGICVDAEGAVWVGSVLRGAFQRVVRGGRVTHEIPLPAGTWATACALGGPDRKTLFMVMAVTTIENQLMCGDFEAAERSTSKGRVEVLDVDVPGAGWP